MKRVFEEVNANGLKLKNRLVRSATWEGLQFGMFGGSFIDNPDFPELNKTLGELAEREKVSKAAIAIAWVLRHPAKMQAIIGSMNPEHIKDACAAADVTLSHHDWYALYLSAGKYLP